MVLEDVNLPFITDEHRIVRRTIREFCREKIIPNSLKWERERFSVKSILMELAKLGVLGIRIPVEYGGQSSDLYSWITMLEELGYADASIAAPVLIHTGAASTLIVEYGSRDIKERYLPKIARGEKILAFAMTEAEVPGSWSSYLKTTAKLDNDHYVINGTKAFITNACIADLFIVFARTDPKTPGHRGVSVFLVEKNDNMIITEEPSLGFNLPGLWGTIIFDDVRVPRENLLLPAPKAFTLSMLSFNRERIGNPSICNGIAQRAFDEAVNFLKGRRGPDHATGELKIPFTDYEYIRIKLAEIATKIKASRLMVYHAAYLIENSLPYVRDVSMAKAFANEVVREVAMDSLQLSGAYGYSGSFIVQKLLRDGLFGGIGGGTIEIQKLRIAEEILRG